MANFIRRLLAGSPALVRRLSTGLNAAATLQQDDTLYRRLSALGYTKKSVASTINEYIREGKTIGKYELGRCIKELRKYKQSHLALEIMEWMEARMFNFAHKDYAIRLDLTMKAKGIEAAENYFNSMPPHRRVHCTYGALLNCYCMAKMTDKALDIFSKMAKDNMIITTLPFNNLMSMYLQLGQPDKAITLREEMKKRSIRPDTLTYTFLMNSYRHLNDIEGVERVFEEMKLENWKQCDWRTYSNLAVIYMRNGYQEKAKLALEKLEEEMDAQDRMAYHFLITLYAGLSDPYHVHRVWKALKSTLRVVTNKSYFVMLESLQRIDDIEGMAKCFEEWESVCVSFDGRLVNSVIRAFLRCDMVEEANSVLERAVKRTNRAFFTAWEMLMVFYVNKGEMKQALRIMETAASKDADVPTFEWRPKKETDAAVPTFEWKPKKETIDKFLECLKRENDVDSAEEFYKLMKMKNCVDSYLYESLIQIYDGAGRAMGDMRGRIEGDGVEMSEELECLVARVCPQR